VAVAEILTAYTYLTLVDIFGDVPQVEALKGPSGNFNPIATSGEEVYTYAISLLDEARTELAKTGTEAGAALSRDIFYGGNRTRWNALANTLELKAWLNLSMIDSRKAAATTRISALLNEDLIDASDGSENFTYKYGTATVPQSRHPLYQQYYDPIVGNAGGYISNFYMFEMFNGYGVEDPRWRYYFYRQVGSIARALEVDPKSLGCAPGAPPPNYISSGVEVFCVFEPGFYGRDHGDGSGTPPDGPVLTCAGVYPAGGRIDNTSTGAASYFSSTQQGQGANGAGIHPIMMAFFTDFMKAEAAVRLGTPGDPKDLMLSAVNKSISQVRAFATSKGQTTTREPSVDNYIAALEDAYDAASNKLDVIGREMWKSAWGNGIEAYNNLRRTSAPRNLQPTLQPNPGPFLRSQIYPADYVFLNENATQKDYNTTNKVFWDTNPDVIN
jgi:hypothetical protein